MESLDTFRTVSFAADFASERLPPVTVSGGDFKGRVFRLSLTDGGQPTQAEGVQCRLGWNADPGEALGSFVEAARVDGTATATWEVEVPSSMLAQPRCKAAWMLYTAGTANVLCTLAFDVTVERPVVDTGSAEGEDLVDRLWTAIDTMEQATDNANAATESAHRAADAAAEAAAKALSQATGNVLASEASGELVDVDDAYPGPLLETKVYGRSEQTVTTGKNLLPVPVAGEVSGGGTTVTAGPDGFAITGTATSSTGHSFYFSDGPVTIEEGMSLVVFLPKGSSNSVSVRLSNDTTIASHLCDKDARVTPLDDYAGTDVTRIVIYTTAAVAIPANMVVQPMIVRGSTATAYEPYTGGAPSPSPEWPQPIDSVSSAEVVTAGGNLAIPNDAPGVSLKNNGVTFTMNEDGSVSAVGMTGSSKASYSYMGTWGVVGNSALGRFGDAFLSSGSTLASAVVYFFSGGEYKTGTTAGNAIGAGTTQSTDGVCVTIEVPANTTVNETVRVMLNAGRKALPWSSPAKSHHLDLQGHELRSLPDGTRDELVVNADGSYGIVQRVGHVVLDGTQEHAAVEIDETHCIVVYKVAGAAVVADTLKNDNGVRSNVLVGTMQNEAWTNGTEGIYRSSVTEGVVALSLGIGFASTLSAINSWFAANPTDLDYALAAETYIPLGTLDPAPSWPDVGVNNAWTVSDLATETGVGYVQSVQVVHDRQEARIAALETAIATLEA